ncbi:hypothetical protein HS1genome_1543 [Sulfodiicoccus acidiphilus]|uniref:Uncharacterized protein n=1 Tax=Sulfodiicoccus acidiphilus TaxID=1670455 RepID=A0A348B4Q2_9CREN|nr:hypothetical protein [Sulfodiicoccus acidiphilus]BBD73154.1 hypothetical protein HS1genome_1543 [Sulfodiicoccus acidiphilus]GGU01194.1 hypothetical protein GCM10007116_17920 [Sulfodiicoccus acidiphilus]
MGVIVRKIHTKKDGGNVWLRVTEEPPSMKNENPSDGYFFVRVGDDSGDKVIRLSDEEALDVAQRILESYRRHVKIYEKLEDESYRMYKMKSDENEED